MFYDLEDPSSFVKDIVEVLAKNGVWHFEQSYMPSMLRLNSYDTICHEHVEYYSLKPVKILLEKCGLKILDVKMNSVNGGSFAVTAAHNDSSYKENSAVIEWLLEQEKTMGLHTPLPFRQFEQRVFEHRDNLRKLISYLHEDGKTIHAYGASTKGNVVLQFCKFNSGEISYVAEINEDKFGKFTPGTHIPIVSDKESKSMQPDYYLVLPWHFKAGILNNEKEYLRNGGSLIFPFQKLRLFKFSINPTANLLISTVINEGVCTGCGICVGLDKSKKSFIDYSDVGPLPNFVNLENDLPLEAKQACPGLNLDYLQLYKDFWNQDDHNPITGKVVKARTGYAADENIKKCSSSGRYSINSSISSTLYGKNSWHHNCPTRET